MCVCVCVEGGGCGGAGELGSVCGGGGELSRGAARLDVLVLVS